LGGINLYRFVHNNPLSLIDADGWAPQLISVSAPVDFTGIVIGVPSGSFTGDLNYGYDIRAAHIRPLTLENVHGALDAIGTVEPTPIADLLNSTIYGFEGNWTDAALTVAGVIPYAGDAGKLCKYGKKATKRASNSVDELVRAAQKEFPSKAGKIEQHHITPKYLGGDPKGPLAPFDAAYHQKITTEFRRLHPYGSEPPSPQRLQEIMRQVYEKYPLPPGN